MKIEFTNTFEFYNGTTGGNEIPKGIAESISHLKFGMLMNLYAGQPVDYRGYYYMPQVDWNGAELAIKVYKSTDDLYVWLMSDSDDDEQEFFLLCVDWNEEKE